jgi:sugar phosphate isomerase/epimerase
MTLSPSRRDWLASTSGALSALALGTAARATDKPGDPFRYCLNTSTISGQKIPIAEEVDIAAKVGYQAIEPWIRELDQHVNSGGSLKDLGKRIQDAGLVVPSAIGFAEWIVDDDARRQKGLEEARRSMDLVQQIGGTRLAAPPVGATNQTDLNLLKAADRYRALLEVGVKMGVIPQVEVWGFSKSLSRVGETALVALECGRPEACILPDVYHLYKGGSDFTGLKLLAGTSFHMLHMNDYPGQLSRAEITDAHRVYPGDGVAPLTELLRDVRQMGFRGFLSLELFNRDYWKQDATLVARTGLEKMKAAVAKRLA